MSAIGALCTSPRGRRVVDVAAAVGARRRGSHVAPVAPTASAPIKSNGRGCASVSRHRPDGPACHSNCRPPHPRHSPTAWFSDARLFWQTKYISRGSAQRAAGDRSLDQEFPAKETHPDLRVYLLYLASLGGPRPKRRERAHTQNRVCARETGRVGCGGGHTPATHPPPPTASPAALRPHTRPRPGLVAAPPSPAVCGRCESPLPPSVRAAADRVGGFLSPSSFFFFSPFFFSSLGPA